VKRAATLFTDLIPTEHVEQCAVISWARKNAYRYPCLNWLYANVNGQNKTIKERAYFKAEGLTSGVADLFLPDPRGSFCGLYIEMKRRKGGKISPEQEEFIEWAKSRGYAARIAFGADQGIEFLQEYLRLAPRSNS
jgi:hypothetical protein